MITEPIKVIVKDLGVIDGLQTAVRINADTGEIVGYNQSVPTEDSNIPAESE